ncbi:MAG TPA: hypothetical protein VM639_21760 [Dongiaceae bacterium]|nr:hypothetical protein [Dongiaceae bacterium]
MREDRRRVADLSTGALTLGAIVNAQLTSLACVCDLPEEPRLCVQRIFELFTRESLNRPALPPFEGLSFINANGLPFQWVFNVSAGASGWGFLCEAGQPGSRASARLALTLQLINEACSLACNGRPDFLRDIAQRLTPEPGEPWPSHWRSAAWVGVAVKRGIVAIKPYFNLTAGAPRERWLQAGWILRDLGRDDALERFCALSSRCSANAWPAGLAVDIRPDGGPGRVKIYFRSGEVTPAWLARWYDTLGLDKHAPSLRRLLDLLGKTGARPYPQSAFVTSLEIHADQSVSLKTDLAVTKWMASDATIAENSIAFLASAGFAPEPLKQMLRAVNAWPPDRSRCSAMRFVGFGCEPDGSRHLNVYVEPPLSVAAEPAPRPHANGNSLIRHSIERGLDALMASRHDDHWQDYSLPVGASDAWVTAYVLAKLSAVHPSLPAVWHKAIDEALDWLSGVRGAATGGWGYNSSVPDDADSTAWAVLALRGWGRPVPRDAIRFLGSCRSGSGFATYPASTSPAPGWARAVPCVSAVALAALAKSPSSVGTFFSRWMAEGNLIPAYWWASPIYTTAMLLTGCGTQTRLTAAFREKVTTFHPASSFERALLIECRLRLGLPAMAMGRDLIAEQNTDGGFAPSALLRLTDPDIEQPWAVIDAGPIFVDESGIFTTATAIAALSRLVDAGPASHKPKPTARCFCGFPDLSGARSG